jgi:hypothetical protein
VPLAKAFERGYYDQMITLIRDMFSEALKTNKSMYFAALTGCLRISRESVFTGLNNLTVFSVTDVDFNEYFGFTDQEVMALLEYYDFSEFYETIKEWYDGYHFGGVDIYCPWDVLCYCGKLRGDREAEPEEYWLNSSGNDVVRRFIEMAETDIIKDEIEELIEGGTVIKEVRQELTYRELYDSIENMWSVLYTTGYLTMRGKPEGKKLHLAIPNTEIRSIFVSHIREWFFYTVRQDAAVLNAFCEAFKQGKAEAIEKQFQDYLDSAISIRDTFVKKESKENFYHGMLIGLLVFKGTWKVLSNRETGDGYSDITIEIKRERIGIIIEVKYSHTDNLEADCIAALKQIDEKRYYQRFKDAGIQTILKYGIACYKKRCKVMLG